MSAVTAHFHGSDYVLGNIDPGGIRSLSVPTAGYDPGDPHLTVQGEAFGEIVNAAAVAAASTPPDPPQLPLSCVYSTQTAQATIITCTVSAFGGVPITSVKVIASPLSGTQTTISLGTLSGGQTAQATFTYTASGLRGQILAQGTADQPVNSNVLLYPVANQPPTPGNPPNCTAEGALADAQPYPPIAGNGTVIVKTQAGCQTFVSHTDKYITGLTVLDYGEALKQNGPLIVAANILPDTSTTQLNWTLAVTPNINTQIPVTQAGLTCNFQPTASLLTVPKDGGLGTVTMAVEPNCQWSSTVDSPTSGAFVRFISGPPPYLIVPPCCTTGPGSVQYLIDANPTGADRTFTLRVGGKVLSGVQLGSAPPCTYSAAATGTLQFAYSGGSGGINITGSPSTCASSLSNSASWLTFTGNVQSGSGTWAAAFTAAANLKLNASSPQRTANLVVSAPASGSGTPFSQSFTVTQAGLQCSFTVPSKPFSIPVAGIPQNQPQTFTVGVTNSACPWTAGSSTPFVHVVNDGVTQTGKTSYTVPYWADASTTKIQRPAYVQVGDQTYGGAQAGDDPPTVTVTAPANDVTREQGSVLPISWSYTGDPGNLKIELVPIGGTDNVLVAASIAPNVPGGIVYSIFAGHPVGQFRIRITPQHGSPALSTAIVSIVGVYLTSPNTGEIAARVVGGERQDIPVTWKFYDPNHILGDTVTVSVLEQQGDQLVGFPSAVKFPIKDGRGSASAGSFLLKGGDKYKIQLATQKGPYESISSGYLTVPDFSFVVPGDPFGPGGPLQLKTNPINVTVHRWGTVGSKIATVNITKENAQGPPSYVYSETPNAALPPDGGTYPVNFPPAKQQSGEIYWITITTDLPQYTNTGKVIFPPATDKIKIITPTGSYASGANIDITWQLIPPNGSPIGLVSKIELLDDNKPVGAAVLPDP